MNIAQIIVIIFLVFGLYLVWNSYYDTGVPPVTKAYVSHPDSELESVNNKSEIESRGTANSRKNMNDHNSVENFKANGFDNPVIDQGTWKNAYALLSPPLTAGGQDTMSQRLVVNQLKTTDYLDLVNKIEKLIADRIIEYAQGCQDMHGSEVQLHDGNRALTLACVSDPYALQDEILDDIYELIYQYIKEKFNINMNAYVVYHDLYMHLNLMEGVIYPLTFSGLYTVHGVQYTTASWIRDTVRENTYVEHTLMTIISRRNIVLEVDSDQHIY